MRRRLAIGLGLVVAMIATVTAVVVPASAAERQLLDTGMGSYPRLVRLEHSGNARDGRIIASTTSQDEQGMFTPIYESTDEGESFDKIGEIRDSEGPAGMCCGTLYEVPQQVGDMEPGTLLWAASYGQHAGDARRIGIKIWSSDNGGRTWSFLSEAARSHNKDGIWEPEFSVDANGTMWMGYADETEAPQYGQVLNRISSTDGVNWSPKERTMAIGPDRVRPGMPIVRKLPDGRYYMSYEICNYGDRFCDAYYKISPDGASWGDPADPGTRVQTEQGNHFQHAHTITLFPGGANGTRILQVGQIYVDAAGNPLPGNGQTLLANDNFGDGAWYEVPAPVQVNNPYDDYCPNYSSTLLPVDDGENVLQVAADYDADGVCKSFFGKGPAS
ncbi:hypothetical protein CFN78_00850 [Amycolatopsis antarctica]|uniref:Bifunctional protein n=1 Tax=Amycolatopsis antarctica TaxID=1854586 RepID=A0A263DBN8_9PSEU|nr:sialidase family protein [Amycolatopsis antarctica]OZM74805.1 hypothetical protein CFN78_00850 [Amycolatopsis antarctica]